MTRVRNLEAKCGSQGLCERECTGRYRKKKGIFYIKCDSVPQSVVEQTQVYVNAATFYFQIRVS